MAMYMQVIIFIVGNKSTLCLYQAPEESAEWLNKFFGPTPVAKYHSLNPYFLGDI
jgi:hypothetical protein